MGEVGEIGGGQKKEEGEERAGEHEGSLDLE